MSKEQQNQLKIAAVEIRRPAPARGTETALAAPTPGQEPMHLSVQVQNPSGSPIYVWASRRAYDYDATTHVLTVYLTEHTPPPPPGIVMISNHPREPELVHVAAGSRATIDIPVPTVMRKRGPEEGLGMSIVEVPIQQIDHVNLHIQYANEPIKPVADESPSKHQARLRAQGSVIQVTIKPINH